MSSEAVVSIKLLNLNILEVLAAHCSIPVDAHIIPSMAPESTWKLAPESS